MHADILFQDFFISGGGVMAGKGGRASERKGHWNEGGKERKVKGKSLSHV